MEKKFFAVIALAFFAIATSAQNKKLPQKKVTPTVSVKMKETNDIIPGDDRRMDKNKQLGAIVKVEVLDEIDDVEGPVMEILNKGVEKWVYMAKGSRSMKIKLKRNLPISINFAKYGIKALKSNRVYIVNLDVPNKIDPSTEVKVKSGNLQMRITPKNAKVYVWGDDKEEEAYALNVDGTLKINLPYGNYHYRVTANGYHPVAGETFVDNKEKWKAIDLEVIKGTLIISCPTKNVDFYVDNELKEKDKKATEWSGELPPGQYVIEARRKGYMGEPQIVNLKGGKETRIELEPLMTERAYKKAHASKQVDFSVLRKGTNTVLYMKDGSTVTGIWIGVTDKDMVKIRQEDPQGEFVLLQKEIEDVEQVNN